MNYMKWENTKNVSFGIFAVVWTQVFLSRALRAWYIHMFTYRYFRHWLNLVILWSAWTEFDLIPYATAEPCTNFSWCLNAGRHQNNGRPQMGFGWLGGWNTKSSSLLLLYRVSTSSGTSWSGVFSYGLSKYVRLRGIFVDGLLQSF